MLRSRPVPYAAAFCLLLTLVCTRLPLLNTLGFEFSFVMALASTAVAALVTVSLVRRRRAMIVSAGAGARELGALVGVNLLLLALPLGVMAAFALVVRNCDILEGAAFYVLLPGAGAVFTTSLAFFAALWFRRPRTVVFLVVALSFAYALLLGYTTPAIYSYNLFYGFFPGLTYDELLPVTGTLVRWRGVTLLAGAMVAAAALLLLAHRSGARSGWEASLALGEILVRPGIRLWTAGAAIALALLVLFRCELGFETTAGHLRSVMPGRIVTPHFVIHLQDEPRDESERRAIAAEHEFRLAQVLRAFSLTGEPTIESFVYRSADERRRLIGAGATSIAKPWTREIHLLRADYEQVLKHELVHVVAGRFSPTIIRASYSTGLVEGLAMAVEWDWGNRTLHQYAAALHRAALAPDIRSLMGFAGFAREAPSISYVLAGSFCRHLIDRFGMRSMVALYAGEDFHAVTGSAIGALIASWREFLGTVAVTPEDLDAVEVFFRTPAVFDRVCPRVVARWTREARLALESGDQERAAARSWQAFTEAGSYAALAIHLRSLVRQERFGRISALADSVRDHTGRPEQYLPLGLLVADARLALGRPAEAESLWRRLLAVDLSPALTEAAQLRLMALGEEDGVERARLLFLTRDSVRDRTADSLAALGSPAGAMVRARALARGSDRTEALAALDAIPPGPARFEAARLRLRGRLLLALGEYDGARTAFWLSLNHDDSAKARERVADWIERCEWEKRHGT